MSCEVVTGVWMKTEVMWVAMLLWPLSTDILGNKLLVPSSSSNLECVTSMQISIFSLLKTCII